MVGGGSKQTAQVVGEGGGGVVKANRGRRGGCGRWWCSAKGGGKGAHANAGGGNAGKGVVVVGRQCVSAQCACVWQGSRQQVAAVRAAQSARGSGASAQRMCAAQCAALRRQQPCHARACAQQQARSEKARNESMPPRHARANAVVVVGRCAGGSSRLWGEGRRCNAMRAKRNAAAW